ncbi:sigma 54-interacting transcriptional regulator [bacterium]|nr:sigma 54-interacting transcriptional regulator [bacterium]MCI0604937.1 sigma 54-interacting transcriptional regulator [bacterium]
MSIRAILFVSDSEKVPASRFELESDSIQTFAKSKPKQLPAAYAVKNEDLTILEKFKDLVFHRGKKLEAKPLSKLLLGHSKIPLLTGSYRDAGQLVRSIRTLLKNAKKDQNLYIIGADPDVFEELWRRYEGEEPLKSTSSRSSESVRSTMFSPLEITRMIREEVPVSLESRFVGQSDEVQLVRQLILRAAKSDEPVLILGDSGTGKEIAARCIHDYSEPPRQPFTPVNCGAIPGELLEAILFGHEKHIFTGAEVERAGLWKETGSGTLFLDEIADLRLDHQAKILRALQEQKIRPIGRAKEIDVQARIVVATNRDLFSMMRAGQFREDLYYRLRTFLIRTPALRDHPEDIPLLARFFWKEITKDEKSVLPDKIVSELQAYRWPGNARELRAILSSLHILFGKDHLQVEHLRLVFQLGGQSMGASMPVASALEIDSHRVECFRHLRRVDEVVHACKVALEPLVERKKSDAHTVESVRISLRRRLNELELLCLNPLLFHTELTFSIVYRLKGKLTYFFSLLDTDLRPALRFWRKELAEEFKLAVSAIFKEVQQLLP